MKFGDKLILLRKRKGMNQEELAEKLGVSRQSVSKWESNNSYPETDKIVQICNIFNCSMDDLINDNITNIDEIQRKDKNNLNIAIVSFLEFITKSINMFSNMKFTSGLKCIIEIIILALILALVGNICSGILSTSIARLFIFTKAHVTIEGIFYAIFMIVWAIVEIIILVHTFKIRYLDYYDKITTEENNDENKNEKIKSNKKEKIIIRDKDDKPFAFLSILSNIIIIFIKFILLFIAIYFVAVLFGLSISLVISLFLTPSSILFLGSDIALISAIIINAIILILIICFIFNKKVKFKKLLLCFLVAVVLGGIGIGISIISFKNLTIDDKVQYTKTSEEVIEYKDNLVIVPGGLSDVEYEIDNSINNIKVNIYYNDRVLNYSIKNDTYYGVNTYEVHSTDKALSPKEMYDMFIPDLKKNIIKTNHYAFKIKVIANEDNVNKLIDNASKVYLFDKKQTKNGYNIINISHKINEEDYCSEKNDYNVVTGEITTSGKCKCNIEEEDNYLNFKCNYEE